MEKYYNGVIGQMLEGLGSVENNSFLVCHRGEVSMEHLEAAERAKERTDIYFAVYEFSGGAIAGAYEPYISIICDMFRRYRKGNFEDFLEECDVYYLHRPVILNYFRNEAYRREDTILLGEVEYEQERMASALEQMLLRLAEKCPVAVALNNFQFASRSTMVLTNRLISGENPNIGILLGVNETSVIPEFLKWEWDSICQKLDDEGRSYHIGNVSQKKKSLLEKKEGGVKVNQETFDKIARIVALMDFEQAFYLLRDIEHRIKFDNLEVENEIKYNLMLLLMEVSILVQDISKALEICEDLEKIHLPGKELECRFEQDYLVAIAYMYQGKLPEALSYDKKALETAKKLEDEDCILKAEMMETQIQMSGWYNIFFCAQEVKVSDRLIEKLMKRNLLNHLAYIYIYAYDNRPENLVKAYRSGELPLNFSKGIKLAKKIGNEKLINAAYQKNIMIAATNGMYEIALFYLFRTYEAMRNKETVEGGRIYSGAGYNLCAVGENELAKEYYDEAVRRFYRLHKSEEIAEVQYNIALSCIMCGEFSEAEDCLTWCMKVVEKLKLNSLRVCNLSKLYGLLALVSILQGKQFNCEKYLDNCRQFLNYVLKKEKLDNGDIGVVHDYAKIDDDMFLYTFSRALLAHYEGDDEAAAELYEKAEKYFKGCEGNQFFSQELFRKSRMECFQALGKEELYQGEKAVLDQYEESRHATFNSFKEEIIKKLPPVERKSGKIGKQALDELLWQESMVLAYKRQKEQFDFISAWQNLIDETGGSAKNMVETVVKNFLNHFNVDCALYVRYIDRKPQVLFNNTGKEMNGQALEQLERSFKHNMGGFVISKISSNYADHQDVVSLFGEDDVCSMVAVPFFNNEKLESFLITYVRMKDNWHSSIDRYMLNEEDLNMYRMLFREVKYSLNRIDAYDKIYEMNTKLYLSAVTDQLTGIYNREGFYRKLNSLLGEFEQGRKKPELGLMFIDLDNFKHYNDTFGHDVGDLILIKMAEIFKELSRDRGFVCRYGGDEFIIVFYTAKKASLEQWAKQIYTMIAEAEGFEKEIAESLGEAVCIPQQQRISCSIGIVAKEYIRDEEEINAMIKQADDLLYTIKTSTKGNYRI